MAMVVLLSGKMALYCAVLSISALPFAMHILIQQNELAFQRDWDDQVNFLENALLDPNAGSFSERAVKALGAGGIYLGVWEPVSLWLKMALASMSGGVAVSTAGPGAGAAHATLNPVAFLACAVVLHGLNACLLVALTQRLRLVLTATCIPLSSGGGPWSEEPTSRRSGKGEPGGSGQDSGKAAAEAWGWQCGAAVGAVLWATHPLRVEVICWLSCLPYLTASAAALGSLLAFVPLLDDASNSSSNLRAVVGVFATAALFMVAILAKAAALPCLGLLLVLQVFFVPLNYTSFCEGGKSEAGDGKSSNKKSSSCAPTEDPVNVMVATQRVASAVVWPALRRLALCFVLFGWGARQALWANHIGMEITAAHPQNALKVPRHIDVEGFNLRSPTEVAATTTIGSSSSSASENGEADDDAAAAALAQPRQQPPPGLMSAAWWESASGVHRWAKAGYSLAWYSSRALWPSGLCIFYPVDKDFHASQVAGPALMAAIATLASAFFTARLLCRRLNFVVYALCRARGQNNQHLKTAPVASTWELVGITWLCAVGLLFPTLGLLVSHGWPILAADRYAYLPTALLVPWVAAGGAAMARAAHSRQTYEQHLTALSNGNSSSGSRSNLRWPWAARACAACVILLVGAQVYASVGQASKWVSSSTLWAHAVAYGPSDVVAHYNLGCVFERQGSSSSSSSSSIVSTTGGGTTTVSTPEEAAALRARGQIAAGQLFEAALLRDPSYGAAWNNWGFVQEAAGSYGDAERCYRRAVALNPTKHYSAHTNLAKLLHLHGRQLDPHEYAEFTSDKIAQSNAAWVQNHGTTTSSSSSSSSSGSSSSSQGGDGNQRVDHLQWDEDTAAEIEEHYREAVAIFPTYGTGLYNLATWLHTRHGSGSSHGRQHAPPLPPAAQVGSLAASRNRLQQAPSGWFNEAAGFYRRAIMAAPHLPEPYFNLAALLHQGASNAAAQGASTRRSSRAAAAGALREAKQLLQFAVETFPAYNKPRELLPVVDASLRDL